MKKHCDEPWIGMCCAAQLAPDQPTIDFSFPASLFSATNKQFVLRKPFVSPLPVLLFCTFSSPCLLLRLVLHTSPSLLAASDLDHYRSGTFRSHGPVDRTPFFAFLDPLSVRPRGIAVQSNQSVYLFRPCSASSTHPWLSSARPRLIITLSRLSLLPPYHPSRPISHTTPSSSLSHLSARHRYERE